MLAAYELARRRAPPREHPSPRWTSLPELPEVETVRARSRRRSRAGALEHVEILDRG